VAAIEGSKGGHGSLFDHIAEDMQHLLHHIPMSLSFSFHINRGENNKYPLKANFNHEYGFVNDQDR